MTKQKILLGHDGKIRCAWCGHDALYQSYHDDEWGRIITEDRALFEALSLEIFQAGLSWLTILRKREKLRAAFFDFNFNRLALCGEEDIDNFLTKDDIIKHRGKISAILNNAKVALKIIETHGSLANYFYSFKDEDIAADEQAKILTKRLKRLGFKFIGEITIYSFMQTVAIVNDHAEACFVRDKMLDNVQYYR